MTGGWVYVLGSNTGTLYIGVTSDLFHRVLQHRRGIRSGFAHKYHCTRLLYFEQFASIAGAIARETQLKGWTRAKKRALIERSNPEWQDLAQHWEKRLLLPCESIAKENEKQKSRIQLPIKK